MSGYVVVIEGDEDGGFSAWSPDLPGCVAAASRYEECVVLMREAIAGHLDVMREHGDTTVSYTHLTLPTTPYV